MKIEPTFPKGDKPLIGLSWKTRPRLRSVPLEFLAAELISEDLDVDFISLHNVTTKDELKIFQ